MPLDKEVFFETEIKVLETDIIAASHWQQSLFG